MKTVTERIKEFNKKLLPSSLEIKYKRIVENEFRFFRGTCHLFYEDLARQQNFPASPAGWLCGDLHLENFGSYKGNNRLVYFDLNDFGEAILAPVAWEIVRMAASIFTAFESLKIDFAKAEGIVTLLLEKYAATLKRGKALYIEWQVAEGIVKTFLQTAGERKQKDLIDKRTTGKGDKLRLLIDEERHFSISEELKKELQQLILQWNEQNKYLDDYDFLDVAFRIAGTGSIGLSRYCFLFCHREKETNYLLLDMKEVTTSALQPYVTLKQPEWMNEAERICTVEDYMQNISPALLGATTFKGAAYIIRELQPSSDKIDFELIKNNDADILQVINDMAVLTASAQLRSAGRKGSATADELIEFGKNPYWKQEIVSFSKSFALQMKNYYKEYTGDYAKGAFKAP
jgi:uncharacterized protein (DUF2252 family)